MPADPGPTNITPAQIRRFRKLARGMAELLEEIRQTEPRANMYLEDSGNWYLLTDDSHDDDSRKWGPRQDRVAAFELVPHSGGGAW